LSVETPNRNRSFLSQDQQNTAETWIDEMKPRLVVFALVAMLPTAAVAQQKVSLPPQISQRSEPPAVIQVEPQDRQSLRFDRHFGAEVEPSSRGSAFARGLARERDQQARTASYGVAYLPLSSKTDVFARAGYGTSDVAQVRTSIPEEGSWRLGFGARYSPSRNAGVRADFMRQDFRTSRIKANIFSFGYSRRF
jgi:outer membrane immunogenic protein